MTSFSPPLKKHFISHSLKGDDEQDKENTHSMPELPLLNSYKANAVLSQKKLHKSPSPMKFQENNETIDQESPQLPNLKTINLESLLRGKGTLL